MDDPYFDMIWWVYWGTSVLLTAFVWWRVRRLRPCWFKALFLSWGMAILFTPSFNTTGDYWVPAIMAAGFDGLLSNTWEAAQPHFILIASVWGALALLGFIFCFITRNK